MVVRVGQESAMFTIDEALELSDALGDAMEVLPAPHPRFSTRCEGGRLIITPVDQASLDWLLGALARVQPWEGVRLAAEEVPPMRLSRVAFYIPEKRHQTNSSTLIGLEKSNPGLSTRWWRVVDRREEDRALRLVVRVDQGALRHMRALGFRLHFRAVEALVTPLDGPPREVEGPPEGGRTEEEVCPEGASTTKERGTGDRAPESGGEGSGPPAPVPMEQAEEAALDGGGPVDVVDEARPSSGHVEGEMGGSGDGNPTPPPT